MEQPNSSPSAPPRLAIVGGGVSGTLLAAQLLRQARTPLDVVLIENTARLGRGLAYGTNSTEHLLNVPAGRMTALPDQPRHFVEWYERRAGAALRDDWAFLPRCLYGDYIEATLEEARAGARPGVTLHRVIGEAVAVEPDERDVRVELQDALGRRTIRVDRVALALGNAVSAGPLEGRLPAPFYQANPWAPGALDDLDPARPLLVLGTGLTMVDLAVSLRRRGHKAGLLAVSRHGLLPGVHERPAAGAPAVTPVLDPPTDGPAPRLRAWVRRFRQAVREDGDGRHWRAHIDSLRAATPALWAGLTDADRARFLRHVRPWWDVARHRMAPEIGAAVAEMRQRGFLAVLAGRVTDVRLVEEAPGGESVEVRIALRGGQGERRFTMARVINATGPQVDLARHPAPLMGQLLHAGLARPDALRTGLSTGPGGALVDATGRPSRRLFTLGPPLRAAQWEATAVPEIRTQAQELARLWLATLERPAPETVSA